MIVSLIVAMDQDRGIGKENRLPWHLSQDLKRFRELTMGHYLLMGRKTWESIGRPLDGRTSIVVTANRHYFPEDCIVVHSVEEGIQYADACGEMELFIVGGGEVFKQALPIANKVYLTQIHAIVQGDVFFPEFDMRYWKEVDRVDYPCDTNNQFPFTFVTLIKKEQDGIPD